MSPDPGSAAFTAASVASREPGVPPDDGRTRLVLVRHGRIVSNVEQKLDTRLKKKIKYAKGYAPPATTPAATTGATSTTG